MSRRRTYHYHGLREAVAFVALFLMTMVCVGVLIFVMMLRQKPQEFGVTFSLYYAESLGLNPEETFTALVTDLGVKDVRIPIYWSDIERAPGVMDFSRLDALMVIAEVHDVDVTLVVGMKVPRWPECFLPSFVDARDELFDGAVLRYVQTVVDHEKYSEALVRWQVENEPLFPYGNCPAVSLSRLSKEVTLVRALDPVHPILLTVSGEQEPWFDLASSTDTIGTSMYRFAYNPVLGPVAFPHSSLYYRIHAFLTGFFVKDVIVSELQMEPWFTGNPQASSSVDIPFTSKDFVNHIAFVHDTRIHEVLLWGAEWWYYEKVHGDASLWNSAKSVFKK